MSDPRFNVICMVINCETCIAPPEACAGCVVTALLGPVPSNQLESAEIRALEVLADVGLVRQLRLVRAAG